MRLKRFIGRWGRYDFPPQKSGLDNFGDLVPQTQRLPGVSGGRDLQGGRGAPQAVGSVRTTFDLDLRYGTPMRVQRDAVTSMLRWGRQRLFAVTHEDDRQGIRWVWAKPINIPLSENARDVPHLQQTVQTSFQTVDPGWRGGQRAIFMDAGHVMDDGWRMTGAIFMDDGHLMDTGLRMNPPKLNVQAFAGDTFTIRNDGTRAAKAIIRVRAMRESWTLNGLVRFGDGHYLDGGAAPSSGLIMSLIVDGGTAASWTWGNTLASGEELIVDGETNSVYVNGVGGRRDAFVDWRRLAGTLGFFEVPPGEHTVRVDGGIGAGGCTLIIEYWDTFYAS